jgi:hypothetical protein
LSSTSSTYKALNIHRTDSNSSDGLISPSDVLSSSSDQIIITERKGSDSSFSYNDEQRPTSSTLGSFINIEERLPEDRHNHPDVNPSPKGVSIGGGQSKISKYPHQRSDSSSSKKRGSGEAQSFFTRAFTGIRSGSQSNVTSGSGGNGGGGAAGIAQASASDSTPGGGAGNSTSSGGSGGKDLEPEDPKQLDFFSRAFTGIRATPQRAVDEDKKVRAQKLENKLKAMDQKSKKFNSRLKQLEQTLSSVDTNPIAINKQPSSKRESESDNASNGAGAGRVALKGDSTRRAASTSVPGGNDWDCNDGNDDDNDDDYDKDDADDDDDGADVTGVKGDVEQVDGHHSNSFTYDDENNDEGGGNIKEFTDVTFGRNKKGGLNDSFSSAEGDVDVPVVNENQVTSPSEQEGSPGKRSALRRAYSVEDLQVNKTSRSRSISVNKEFEEDIMAIFHERERLLVDDDFEKIFGMTKSAFSGLPKWRQLELKKRFNLF